MKANPFTPRRLHSVRAATLALAVVATLANSALSVRAAAAAAPAAYTVHEWGTFTSVQGPDGEPIPWNPFGGPSDLPSFVFNRQLPTRNTEVLCPRAGHFRMFGLKDANTWLQRMETPVLYFHADQPLTVDVHVRLPLGTLTEWFPQVTTFGPVAGIDDLMPPTDEVHLRWSGVRVLPPAQPASPVVGDGLPTDDRPSHYYAARKTDANLVEATRPFVAESKPQRDRVLFYRGAGNFPVPLHVSLRDGDTTFVLANQGLEPITAAFGVRVEHGQVSFSRLPALPAGATVHATVPGEPTAHSPQAERLGLQLQDALAQAGLNPDEAAAMVQTWKDSWFTENGLRVLYLLPQPWTDRTLPLELNPPPQSLVRVMLGRADLLPHVVGDRVAGLVADYLAGDHQWAVTGLRGLDLGRFLEPAVTRAARQVRRASSLPAQEGHAKNVDPRLPVTEEDWNRNLTLLTAALR